MTLGIDVGGTFTDAVRWDGHQLVVAKTSSTEEQSQGVTAAAQLAQQQSDDGHDDLLLHGTTVATNALLERRGATTALVTDRGFVDLIEIGRQDRPSLYDTFADRPTPLVPRHRRFGLDVDAIDALIRQLAASGAETVAVSLLYSYERPEVEQRLADVIAHELEVPVSVSHQVAPEFREFERLSTTVVNAYLKPQIHRYLSQLSAAVHDRRIADDVEVMRSSGGLMTIDDASDLPAAMLLSGPAGGVVAAAALGEMTGHRQLISFDMGGTSTDVCRIDDGRPAVLYERAVDGYACRMPSVAVHTVGAGGGSVAWRDEGGALRVGPVSAGAIPGPACYDRGGTQPTVTDANVVLGRIDPSGVLADGVRLDRPRAVAALTALDVRADAGADPDALAAALGIVAVAEEHMAQAIRVVSLAEGADPRDAMLVSFGGAGGLHATALARQLGMAGVLVPPHAGVFSAFGLLLSPRRFDLAQGVRIDATNDDDFGRLIDTFAGDPRIVARTGGGIVRLRFDMRYVGQAHETTIDHVPGGLWPDAVKRFHAAHHQRNGFERPDDPVEIVAIRAECERPPALRWRDLDTAAPVGEPRRGQRELVARDGVCRADVWWRPALTAGTQIVGPAIIEAPDATVFINSGEVADVHHTGTLEVTW
ncbi:MAG: hydantoinase/oxoprolinase family protein [Nitriliruptoraceae bacterium]